MRMDALYKALNRVRLLEAENKKLLLELVQVQSLKIDELYNKDSVRVPRELSESDRKALSKSVIESAVLLIVHKDLIEHFTKEDTQMNVKPACESKSGEIDTQNNDEANTNSPTNPTLEDLARDFPETPKESN